MSTYNELRILNNRTASIYRFIMLLVVLMAMYGLGLTLGAYNAGNVYKEKLKENAAIQADSSIPCQDKKKLVPTINKLELL